jgi:chaperonin GroES
LKIKPVFDRLVIEKIEQASQTKSGLLVIPDDAKSPSQLGRVVAVGHGRNYDGPGQVNVYRREPGATGYSPADFAFSAMLLRPAMVVKPGDMVIFGKYAGAEVEVDGQKVFILREDEVLGIVEEEPTPEAAPVH